MKNILMISFFLCFFMILKTQLFCLSLKHNTSIYFSTSNNTQNISHAPSIYDHLLLVETWPPTFCTDGPRTGSNRCHGAINDDRFLVHGLWPSDPSGKSLISCEKPVDVKAAISNETQLLQKMYVEWKTLTCPDETLSCQAGFWGHEFNKHGNCMSDKPKDYFLVTLQLKAKVNLFDSLKRANILPDNEKLYRKSAIKTALKADLGTDQVSLQCMLKNNNLLLLEISICCDKTAKNFIPCKPGDRKDSCTNVSDPNPLIKLPSSASII